MRRLLLVLAIAACGGDDSGGSGGPVTIDNFDQRALDAYCRVYVECGLIDDLATCRSLDEDPVIDASLRAAIESGAVIFHPDKAEACFATYGGTCERARLFDYRTACAQVFEGTVGDGGACAMDEVCISQSCNTLSCAPETCCQGTCIGGNPPVGARVGESCTTIGVHCEESYCDRNTGVCTAYLADGATCTNDEHCASRYCDGTCLAAAATGESCVSSDNCFEIADKCHITSKTCVTLGVTGDPCTVKNDCAAIYVCDPTGHCKLGPRLGESCNEADFEGVCLDASYCEPSTLKCTALKADGATCTDSDQCASDLCGSGGTCVTPPVCI